MDTYPQSDAADEAGVAHSSFRSAKLREVVHPLPEDSSRFSSWEVRRFQHRRDPNFAMSLHLREIPVATTPLPQVAQFLLDDGETLVRIFSLPPSFTRARFIAVIGDLQRRSKATDVHWRSRTVYTVLNELCDRMKQRVPASEVVWAILPGFLFNVHCNRTDVPVVSVSNEVDDEKRTVKIMDTDDSRLEVLEERLGGTLRTWPAVRPDDSDQQQMWEAAVRGTPPDPWLVDPLRGADTMASLRRLHGVVDNDPEREAVVRMISRLYAGPRVYDAAVLTAQDWFKPEVLTRFAVQVLTWNPSKADLKLLDSLSEGDPIGGRHAVDPNIFLAAVTWLRSIDRVSPPTPERSTEPVLRHFLLAIKDRYGDDAVPDHDPIDYSVEQVNVTGSLGRRWLATLTPGTAPDDRTGGDNSEPARRYRALRQEIARTTDWTTEYGPIQVDHFGIPSARYIDDDPNAPVQVLVTYPHVSDFADVDFTGARVRAEGHSNGAAIAFLDLPDGRITPLPHTATFPTAWGYSGTSPHALVDDICAVYEAHHGKPSNEFYSRVLAAVCAKDTTHIDIPLD